MKVELVFTNNRKHRSPLTEDVKDREIKEWHRLGGFALFLRPGTRRTMTARSSKRNLCFNGKEELGSIHNFQMPAS
jgi:hypothetical protein